MPPEVRLTMQEYEELLALARLERAVSRPQAKKMVRMKAKRVGKKDPKMAKALRKANKLGRTKTGKLRKGYTQAKIMKKAHQLRRKM